MGEDIFGKAFADYLSGTKDANILVDINIGEREELPVAYFFRDYDTMPAWEKQVLDDCKGAVLDVGAGAGSHGLYLQQKGLDVLAVDISKGAVDCMKSRGIRKAVHQDFFILENQKFDTILFLMNGAGMAKTLDGLLLLLEKARDLLADDGVIYLESTDLLYMFEEEDGSAVINLAGNYYGEIEYQLHYKGSSGHPFPWLFVDFENLADIAKQASLDAKMYFEGETSNYIAALSHRS
jgi:SAM-dependent methyltransferase